MREPPVSVVSLQHSTGDDLSLDFVALALALCCLCACLSGGVLAPQSGVVITSECGARVITSETGVCGLAQERTEDQNVKEHFMLDFRSHCFQCWRDV